MILPAALRYLALIAESGVAALEGEVRELVDELVAGARRAEGGERLPGRARGPRAGRSTPATSSWRRWTKVREAADKLEKIVADDLWPLPKYEEMLFIK